MLKHWVFFVALFATFSANAAPYLAPSDCAELLSKPVVEKTYLSGFIQEISQNRPTNFKKIESLRSNVFKVTDKLDREYLLRFAKKAEEEPSFEVFAAMVFQQAPGVLTPLPQIVPLTDQTRENLWPQLRTAEPSFDFAGVSFTVAAFLPLQEGYAALAQHGYDVRRVLKDMGSPIWKKHQRIYVQKLAYRWNLLSDQLKLEITHDMLGLYPDLGVSTAPDIIFFNFIRTAADRGPMEMIRLKTIEDLGWPHLPASVRTQLADQWALSAALGISDPHPSNWLIDSMTAKKPVIVRIDLAWRALTFEEGHNQITLMQSPIGSSAEVTKSLQRMIKKDISPEMRLYLASLAEGKMPAIAKETSFKLTEAHIEGTRKRVQLILSQ